MSYPHWWIAGDSSEDLKNFDESHETIAVYALINIEWQLGFAVDNVAIFATENMEKPHEPLEKMETLGMEIQKNMETSGKLTILFQGFHRFHPQNWDLAKNKCLEMLISAWTIGISPRTTKAWWGVKLIISQRGLKRQKSGYMMIYDVTW